MASTEKHLPGSIASLMTTELNSLANNALAVASSAFNNAVGGTGDGYTRAILELVVTFGVAPTANTGVTVWLLRQPDGTNYEDGSSSVTPTRAGITLGVRAVTTAQRTTAVISLPPGNFKALVLNNGTGQAFAASGNTLRILPFTPQGA
jgi:hypothetical protein